MPDPAKPKAPRGKPAAPTAPVPVPAAPLTPAKPATPPPATSMESFRKDFRFNTVPVQTVTTVRFSSSLPGVGGTGVKSSGGLLSDEQFAQVYAVAKLAAEKGLTKFSLDAIRNAVRPGPPAAPATDRNNGGRSYTYVTVNGVQYLVEQEGANRPDLRGRGARGPGAGLA